MQCAYCAGALKFYSFQIKESQDTPQRAPCEKCGSNHVLHKGSVEAINPRPLPINEGRVVMPWRSQNTRPIEHGMYECRFAEIEPRTIDLWWNGRHFSHADQRVTMHTFIAWRGVWA